MKAYIKPSKAKGKTAAPASKSMAHRMLICAGLSHGRSEIAGVAYSEDILATLDCLETLGAKIQRNTDVVIIEGTSAFIQDSRKFFCRESGSTLRFFLPVLLLSKQKQIFSGYGRLMQRPMTVYENICEQRGLMFARENGEIAVKGQLEGGTFEIKGNISSQFISGMLFALPLCSEDSTIKIEPPIESKSYIDMTVDAMKAFGVSVEWQDEYTLYIRGNQSYKSANVAVEGDWSNAAFLDAFSLVGGDVSLSGLDPYSKQGDKIYKEHFSALKKGFSTVDLSDCPDLGPILMALAAHFHGARFTNTARLSLKESDRGKAMAEELSKFGAETQVLENEITVKHSFLKAPAAELSGYNDHRIVMSLCVLASVYGGVINGAQAVEKSYPDFFDVISGLGVEVELNDDK